MRFGKYLLSFLWRSWVFLFFVFTQIFFLPALFLFTNLLPSKKQIFKISKLWSKCLLFFSGILVKKELSKKIEKNKTYIICSNHVSSLDIALIYSTANIPLIFIGKSEITKFPIFGYYFKKNSISVDRQNLRDSYNAYVRAKQVVKKAISVCVFTEGGIPKPEVRLRKFKNGAFKIALESGTDILPVVIYDNKKRFPWSYFQGSPGISRIKYLDPIQIRNFDKNDLKKLNNFVFDKIDKELKVNENI